MPNNWNTYKLFEINPIQIIDGDRGKNYPSKNEFLENGYCLFLSAKNITKTGFEFSELSFISEEKDSLLRKGKLETNDIILTTRGTIGNVGYYKENFVYKNVRINSGMVVIRVDEAKISSSYVYQLFKSSVFQEQISSRTSGSAQPQLPIRDLSLIDINLPENLQEQQSIASILSDIDDKIENNLAINKTLEEMAMALYKHWFVDFGPFQDGEFVESELGMIPKDWEVKSLENIGDFKNGKGINASKRLEDGKYIILGSNGVIGKTDEIMFKEPVIAIGRVGANYGEVHYSIEPCWISDNAITVQPQIKNHYWFIYQILKEVDYSNFATGSAQPLITQSSVKALKFSCPDLESLDLYSSKIEILYNKRSENIKENQALTQLRDTLLPQLISGAVRLKEFRE